MLDRFPLLKIRPGFALGLAAAALAPLAHADDAAAPAVPAAPAQQESVTEELIRLLAEHNALSRDDAEKLIQRLKAEHPAPAATDAAAAPPEKGRVRVIYMPETERARIKEEVKQEVMQQARDENWAQPEAVPSWTKRLRFDGDIRFRQEFDMYGSGNAAARFPAYNFQAINSASTPPDTNPNNTQVFPFLDTTENRELPRIRARLGLTATIADDITGAIRIATGNTTNPVSTNQTLGTDFNKASFVLDRAYLAFQPMQELQVSVGRMPNPWLSTEMIWDEDLNFDGLAARYHWLGDLSPFVTLGAFSIENSALDFPSTQSAKFPSRDKWLFGGQLGANWRFAPESMWKGGVAFYDFYHLEGTFLPCFAPTAQVQCEADQSRSMFMQKGNTLFGVRDVLPFATPSPTDPAYNYFGLASPFRVLDVTTSIDFAL
ncbi:MAG TPA: putative porin, partial [Nevskiaceae bacterium]|nr:putative porin [Nevskiaceae bacterium]